MTTDSKHGLPGAANFLARTVTPAAPNQVWTSEMTSLWTDEGWLSLAIVLKRFNREVVGGTEAAHDHGSRDGGPDYGLVPQAPGRQFDAPFRPG